MTLPPHPTALPPAPFAQVEAQALLHALPDPLLLVHMSGELHLNAAAQERLGAHPSDGQLAWQDLFRVDSVPMILEALQRAWQEEQGQTSRLNVAVPESGAPALVTVAPAGTGWAWLQLHSPRDPLEVALELMDGLGLGMSVQGRDTRILHANHAAQQITGLSYEQMTGRDSLDPQWQATGLNGQPLAPEQFPSVRALATGEVQRDALMRIFHPPSEQWRWLRVTSIPRRSLGVQEPEQTTTLFADVTEQFHAQEKLRRSERRFRSLVEASAQIVWDAHPDGSFHPPQPGWETFTGQTPEEYSQDGWLNAVHPEDQAQTLRDWTNAVANSGLYVTQHRLRRHDGVYVPMQVRAVPVPDDQGVTQEYLGTHTDISAIRKVEEALHALNAQLEQRVQQRTQEVTQATRFSTLLLQSAGEGIFGVDVQGRVTLANPAVGQLLGYDPQEMLGQDKHALIHHHHADGTPYARQDSPIYQTLQDGQPRRVDNEVLWHREGYAIPVEYIVTPIHGDDAQVRGAVVMVQDITQRLKAQQALEQAVANLERSNQELEQFAYVASHDLQEPLRTIGSYTELLTRRYQGHLDDRADQYLSFMQSAVTRMRSLIHDLLDFSKVSRQTSLRERISLLTVVSAAQQNLAATLHDSGGQLFVDAPQVVLGHKGLLTQLFTNLISNGLKFVPPGTTPHVQVSARSEGEHIQVTVQDNGIGIAPEYHERVFDIFQRLHRRETFPGNGMGLALCRKIVEHHGGRLWLHSEPGQGSAFHFTLPAAPPKEGPEP